MKKEIWKNITGYEGKYQISNIGRLKSFYRGRVSILRPVGYKERYLSYFLCKNGGIKKFKVHHLVISHFKGACPKGQEINHKNGLRFDNQIDNLEYLTKSENQIHAIKNGLRKILKGSEAGSSKLTEDFVLQIREKHSHGFSQNELSKIFKVRQSTIWYIIKRLTWKHI